MVTGVTTEWEDIQVKMGNWLPREKQITVEEVLEQNIEKAEAYDPLRSKKLDTLN